ncbi:MAG: hypothetical protein QM767_21520 [Anaeromyxobacter sp.]
MTRRRLATALALALLALAVPAAARADVPVHVRLIKGSRATPGKIDAKLNDLQRQFSKLAYQTWEQVREEQLTLVKGKTVFVNLPDGDVAGLTLQDEKPNLVTLEVALVARNTQSTLSVEKGQRLLHMVTGEKGGAAYFLAVKAWPEMGAK